MPFNKPPPQLKKPFSHQDVKGLFWKPNDAFIDELADSLNTQKVLEIFAGNGYLASLLNERGVNVLSTSLLTGMDAHEFGLYHPVENLDAVSAVKKYAADYDVLLMCWPTVTSAALNAALAWGDKPIAYIGEVTNPERGHFGGCATDEFFELLEKKQVFHAYKGNMMEHAFIGHLKLPTPEFLQNLEVKQQQMNSFMNLLTPRKSPKP